MQKTTPIKIRTITYDRVKNLGNYENEKIHVEALLEEGEDPDIVLNGLRDFVDFHLQSRPLNERLNTLKEELKTLKAEVAQLRQERDSLRPASNDIAF